MVREPNLLKVCLENQGEDSETPWAHDLGPAKGPKGSRKVRLVNVPFLHAKPTWGDVIVVSPVEDGLPTWDSKGVPWAKIHTRIAEDGGRWAMIVDYLPHDRTDGEIAFQALHRACMDQDVICEGAWGPREDKPGRAYFAAPEALDEHDVMATLATANLPCALTLIHPVPVDRPAKQAAKPKPRSRTAAAPPRSRKPAANGATGRSAAATPARAKATGKRPAKAGAAKPAAPKPAARKPAKPAKPAARRSAKKSLATRSAAKRSRAGARR